MLLLGQLGEEEQTPGKRPPAVRASQGKVDSIFPGEGKSI